MPANSSFRFDGKYVFLTYPQCDVEPSDLLAFLQSTGTIVDYVIGRERHESEALHLHALIRYDRRVCTRNARNWDYQGHHPNLQRMRGSPADVERIGKYCSKDGDTIVSSPDWYMASDSRSKRSANDCWADICASTTKEEFLQKALELQPRDFVLQHNAIVAYSNKRFRVREDFVSPFSISDFREIDQLAEFWMSYIQRPRRTGRPRSLILIGPSRWGKTAWARSLGPHAYCHSYYSLEIMRTEGIDYFVIDDVPFERFPSQKAILGCQEEITLTDKYCRKETLKWGIPTIVCLNDDMWVNYNIDPDFKQKNCVVVRLINSLIP